MAKEKNKIFIAVKLVQEVTRKTSPGKTTVVISENINGAFTTEFTRAIDLQTDLKQITLSNTRNKEIADFNTIDANVLLTTPTDALYLFESKAISLEKVNLVILNDCHLVSNSMHPYVAVIGLLKSHDLMSQPVIIGLASDLTIHCPVQLKTMLETLELVFGCQCSVSSDLVAVNQFGEQPCEQIITCSFLTDETNEKTQQLSNILMSLYNKLALIDLEGQPISIRAQCLLCDRILGCFGSIAAIYHARSIVKEISKLKKKLTNELECPNLLFCEAQLNLMFQYRKNDELPDITPLVENIISSLSYLRPEAAFNSKTNPPSGSDKAEFILKNQNDDITSTIKVTDNTNYGCHGDIPVSIILCCVDQEAAALNFLINKLAKTKPELAFIHSRHISSSMIKQNDMSTDIDTDEARNEDIVRLIYEGQVNVVITSQEVENDIYLGQCKQVIRIGVPEDYRSYVRVKKIPRMAQAEFIIVESEEKGKDDRPRYNVFKEIEDILARRCQYCPSTIKPDTCSEDVANYILDGKDGPCVEARSAIALINRYCKAFPYDGLSCPLPWCRVKVIEEDNQIRVVSRLHLPRHSPVFWSFKGTATVAKEQASPERLTKTRIESTTRAAFLACKALLEVGEMNIQLQPTIRQTNITLKKADAKCAVETADGVQGVEGSTKRRRAYQKKFATVLMNNLAVAREPVYLYSISITVKQLASHEDTASYNIPPTDISDISLGILSRNRLPKVPSFLLYGRAGELKVSIIECTDKPSLTSKQLALIQRFHHYVYTNIININGDTGEQCFQFEPEKQSFGFYLVLLGKPDLPAESEPRSVSHSNELTEGSCVKGSADCDCLDEVSFQNLTLHSCKESTVDNNVKTLGFATEKPTYTSSESNQNTPHDSRVENLRIAFNFIENLEQQLGDFKKPQHPPPTETRNFELFRNRVVTAAHMAKPTNYFVANICYDLTPLSPFPGPAVAATFAEYYRQRYDVELQEDQPLLSIDHITKRLNLLLPRHQNTKGKDLLLPDKNSKRRQRSHINLIPQLCSIHPITAPLWQEMLYIPSILYRLECLLAAEELRQSITLQAGVGSVEYSEVDDLPLLATGESVGENCNERSFMEKNSEHYDNEQSKGSQTRPGPSSTLLLRAVTCLGACDGFSHERLEMYGDALIKHSVTLNLYCESPFSNVGQISFLRGQRVSNRQLFYLGCALNIPSYIRNAPFNPFVNWHPHGFVALSTPQERYLQLNAVEKDVDLLDVEDEKTENEEADEAKPVPAVLVDGENHVVVSDKVVADTTEAIIGAYLVTCGFSDALRVMKWIGLDVRTKEHQDSTLSKIFPEPVSGYVGDQGISDSDEYCLDGSLHHHKESLDTEFREFQEVLGYTFRNQLLLLQAFTHVSYPRDYNHVHTSYEHLEFLGDAVLDYLITRYLYHTQRTMSPGALTDLRSAVVNSYSFAFMAVKYGFHKHLRSLSPAVFRLVNTFVVMHNDKVMQKMKENPNQIFSSVFVPMDDNQKVQENLEGVEVPKILADLFESVIGAVFIDCGQDEEKTWDVVYPLLQATLEHYSKHLPVSPVRELQEMLPNSVSLLSVDHSIAGKYTCTLLVKGVGKFKGTGRSYKIARSTAAQRAVARIQSQKQLAETTETTS